MVFRFPARDGGIRHSEIEERQNPHILQQRVAALVAALAPAARIVVLVALTREVESVAKAGGQMSGNLTF
jgi:hypothetical protein